MSVIGTNIKNIRTKKNMSAKELSKKCGLSELVIMDIESGKKIPNTSIINSISKALGVQIDAIEPAYFSDYFEEEKDIKKDVQISKAPVKSSYAEKIAAKENTISDAFTKAIKKIPVLNKITPGKKLPNESDIVDYKFEPVFQGKSNAIAGESFIYYMVNDNSMSGSRVLKGDLALVFLTESILNKDIIIAMYNNKPYIRRYKALDDKKVLLYPDNPEHEVIIADSKEIQIIGKIVRVEFKI